MSKPPKNWQGISHALLAAVLFGASTPLAKVLLPQFDPILLAGLLYLGSGFGLAVWWLLRSRSRAEGRGEAGLARQDLPWLAGAFLCGGVAGPILLMLGLATTPASTASLLLNLEGVLTALLAWFVFKEHFDARIMLGMALITSGAGCLSWIGRPQVGVPWGALAIVGACLAWALDNNLTRKVSSADPVQTAMLKGLVAGGVNTSLALLLGAKLPSAGAVLGAAVVGLLGYGVSLTLFVFALRHIGTARTGAYFSIAPFVGAALAIGFLRDPLTLGSLVGAAFMGLGVWLHLSERHAHQHRHESMDHDHLHTHDEHHLHPHSSSDPPGEPHAHPHHHQELVHSHAHYPEIHHRHEH
jgi:drug/metabolite transporter (DMT)-like permease